MKTKKVTRNIGYYIILALFSLMVLIPVLWMVSTAFKPEVETFTIPPRWIPENPTLDSFRNIRTAYPFFTQLKNSFIVVVGSTIITVIFACFSGYGVTRFKFKGRKQFMSFLLVTQMFPSIMVLVPFYTILNKLNLINTYWGLIVVYVSMSIAFATWMITSFFKSIPISLDEAAIIDGCTRFQVFWKIVLPLTIPGLVSICIYCFINGWNEYMFASTFVTTEEMKTITVGIAELSGQYKILWNDMMAASLVASVPLVVLFVFLQKYFISGMTAGAVKN
ncbi:carbohydrate ABC transporter permease [Vallitalea longa]|nr:carbohydrate ABC transporter permease [Vallitalea longa]